MSGIIHGAGILKAVIVAAVVLGGMAGCARPKPKPGILISSVRQIPPDRQVVELPVLKSDLAQALQDEKSWTQVRLVQVYKGGAEGSSGLPEYRIFNIAPGSVYQRLGLQNNDILVAASDYIVPQPDLFKHFVKLLPNEAAPTIEIRRAGRPLLFKYTIR